MSIGEKISVSHTADAINDGRVVLRPNLIKGTQATTKNGKLTNRNATRQKKVEQAER